KPLHPAWAAHGAVLAARLAGLGAEGPPGVIEGRFGLYHAFVGAAKGELPIDEEIESLGERWETPRIAYKPYPACHFIHGSLGACSSLHGRAATRRRSTRRIPPPSRGASGSASGTGGRSRPTSPTSAAARRTRCPGRRCSRSSARTPAGRCPKRPSRRSSTRFSPSTISTTCAGCSASASTRDPRRADRARRPDPRLG